MAKIIYKYPLVVQDVQTIKLPSNAEILSVQSQIVNTFRDRELVLWAIVNPQLDTEQERTIHIIGTGNPMPNKVLKYLGTTQMNTFVWHIFEEI